MLRIEHLTPGPGEDVLYRELLADLPVPVPSVEAGHWPGVAGILAAREDGALLAWVVFFADGRHGRDQGDERAAVLQWITVERERERIASGYNTEHPGTPTEIETLAALATEAAASAKAAGYAQLRWHPAEPDLAEGIASLLGARTVVDAEGFRSYALTL